MDKSPTWEIEMKLAALSEAMCDVLATVAADTVVIRRILDDKKMVSDSEFDAALEDFRKTDNWQRYRDFVSKNIRERAKAKFDSMRGPVN